MTPLASTSQAPRADPEICRSTPKSIVAKERRLTIVSARCDRPYRVNVGNDQTAENGWGEYLKRMTSRPGWSVARLAREAGINRATAFKWISGRTGVTVANVRLVAQALGDDPNNALRAAAGSVVEDNQILATDEEIQLVNSDPRLSPVQRTRVLRMIHDRRAREREAGLAETRSIIDALGETG